MVMKEIFYKVSPQGLDLYLLISILAYIVLAYTNTQR